MSVVFSALGWLAIVLGGGWVALAANAARSIGPDGSAGPIPTIGVAADLLERLIPKKP